MPQRDTVAGLALSRFSGSKMSLTVGGRLSLSPLASVRILESSRTELRFSIQFGSTGPSRTIQKFSPALPFMVLLHRAEKIPSVQSFVDTSSLPNIWPSLMDFGFILNSLCCLPVIVRALIRIPMHSVLPTPLGPRTMMPCLTSWVSYS